MLGEWRISTMIPLYKNKGNIQDCKNYQGIKLLSHTAKLWERIIEGRLRKDIVIRKINLVLCQIHRQSKQFISLGDL